MERPTFDTLAGIATKPLLAFKKFGGNILQCFAEGTNDILGLTPPIPRQAVAPEAETCAKQSAE